jgi:hypothetical protein
MFFMSASCPSVRLSRLLRELERAGHQCGNLTYRKVWAGAVEGRFPAHQVNGLWHYNPDDASKIGTAYGLHLKTEMQTAA